ncbi:MAG: T9SS type A sorting domain-containing protein [Bacteroidetes bacterium]|nr:T9SS type A sorting domain-containing protein [Bacteroidota bacterium]
MTHSDSWVSSTGHLDSLICFTSLSCKGNNCTAGAIITTDPNHAVSKRLTIFRSNDGGVSWHEQPFQIQYPLFLTNSGITKIQQIDSLHAVGIADAGYVIRTTDAGITWRKLPFPVNRQLSDIDYSDSLTGIVVGVGLDSEVFTTTDGGSTWTDRTQPGYSYLCSCRSFGNGVFRFFRIGHGPIYTTRNNFKTVDSSKLIFDSLSDPKNHYDIENCTYTSGDTILAYGRLWPKDTVDIGGGYGLIMRSTDGGVTWEKPSIYPTSKISYVTKTTPLDRDTIYADGFSNFNILFSTDRGASWRSDTIIVDTSFSPSACWGLAMTGDGHPIASFSFDIFPRASILSRGRSGLSHVEVVEKIRYYTYCYPNPAHNVVHISSIDHSNRYGLYDIFGRVVARGVLSAEGTADIDVSHLPPGMYAVVLEYFDLQFCAGKIVVQ